MALELLTRFFGGEDTCSHEDTELIAGNCTYDDVHLREGQIVLTTYRPYYPYCMECDETLYETRYTSYGDEHPLGEVEKRTSIPHHAISEYLHEHQGRYSV